MLLHAYLEKSAQKWPEKVAVRCRKETITFAALNKRADRIANMLRSYPGLICDNIGLYVNKSISAVAAIFGILKSGAAYVPLDTESPAERIAYICSDCQLRAIVTDRPNLPKLIRNRHLLQRDLLILVVENDGQKPETGPLPVEWTFIEETGSGAVDRRCLPDSGIQAEDRAYILYTSGSTGRPKGVMLSHRNATVFVDWSQACLNITQKDVLSSHAPFHFDLSIFDLYVAVKTGATLCLIPPGLGYFPDAMVAFIHQHKITVWYSVPSVLINFLSVPNGLKDKLASLKTLIYAGEVFNFSLLNQLRPFLTDCDIYNLYGPTETNVITYYKIAKEDRAQLCENVPIGRPCPYAAIRVVDEDGQPVRAGETGQLIVNGDSLMKGYRGDPDKTRSRMCSFVDKGRSEMFYATGDLVYEKPDGNIVYVNRKDHMVKTRGFRVELGEIEAALYQQGVVRKAAVVAVPDEKIGHRLFAFVELNRKEPIPEDDLEDNYHRKIPTYMIPEKTFQLETMPQTSTGKIDRRQLVQIAQRK